MAEQIIFLIAAGVALGLGVIVVTESNPFRAAVSLIGTLVAVAVIFLLLAAPFVAMIQLIVYAGAIVVLFLFVIAYLGDRRPPELRDPLAAMEPFAWLSVLAIGLLGGIMLAQSRLPGLRDEPGEVSDIGSPEAIGRGFLDDYIVSFEGVSFVLLVAAIGAVLLAKRAVQFEGGR
jgi:NADH-quinone oxidoreductase subunit J